MAASRTAKTGTGGSCAAARELHVERARERVPTRRNIGVTSSMGRRADSPSSKARPMRAKRQRRREKRVGGLTQRSVAQREAPELETRIRAQFAAVRALEQSPPDPRLLERTLGRRCAPRIERDGDPERRAAKRVELA